MQIYSAELLPEISIGNWDNVKLLTSLRLATAAVRDRQTNGSGDDRPVIPSSEWRILIVSLIILNYYYCCVLCLSRKTGRITPTAVSWRARARDSLRVEKGHIVEGGPVVT